MWDDAERGFSDHAKHAFGATHQRGEIKASLIFTSNDVVINLGVIVAGLMVYWLNSNMPDLIIGAIVFFIVSKGAIRILSLSKNKVH